uniref:Tetratricopeptide repeat domain 8 n=1 Tax=Sarcophilus harrisii TaxID=9305 RepID=A0A7N4PK18_SARHA
MMALGHNNGNFAFPKAIKFKVLGCLHWNLQRIISSIYLKPIAAWILKTRALTEMVYVDEIDVDQEGIAEMILDENAIAQVARPGTSLKLSGANQVGGPSPAVRPITQTGRPITGFVRPGTQSGRPGTMEQAIRTPRTAYTAHPITSSSGRYVRLGTASMLTNPDGPFINLSRLNLAKYAQKPKFAK